MRTSLKLSALLVMVALVLGTAVLATVARTFRADVSLEFAYAIWNDEQLVVFVVRRVQGTNPTVLEQLGSSVVALTGTRPARSTRLAIITNVVRYQDGVVQPSTYYADERHPDNAPFPNPLPRFFNGRALVVFGFWNGNESERVA